MKIDVIGDVHGCYHELCHLFEELGYQNNQYAYIHPDGRIPVFVRFNRLGPDSIKVIQLVYEMVVSQKVAKYVPGNHCNKLYRFFLENKVQHQHGLETTVAEYEALDKSTQEIVRKQFMTLYEEAPLYLQLPDANAIVAHAGIKKSYIGRQDKKVKTFVLYGDITGEFDEEGRPIRRDWAQQYHGDEWIVYGHTPVISPRIVHKTINIDTGCVFGNKLSAFRLPEQTTVSVPSKQPFMEEKFKSFPDD